MIKKDGERERERERERKRKRERERERESEWTKSMLLACLDDNDDDIYIYTTFPNFYIFLHFLYIRLYFTSLIKPLIAPMMVQQNRNAIVSTLFLYKYPLSIWITCKFFLTNCRITIHYFLPYIYIYIYIWRSEVFSLTIYSYLCYILSIDDENN